LATEPQSSNLLLNSLTSADFTLLRDDLTTVKLTHEAVLYAAGDPITQVYFPHSGVISLVVGLLEGEMIEVAMVGRDSVAGASSALDGAIALNHAIVQLPGEASVLDVAKLRIAAEKSVSFRTKLIRHQQVLFVQAQQSAACNTTHSVESRLSRWLLRMHDLSGTNTLQLTQEFLAQMVGAQRTSVSLVAHALQQSGLIRYHRGQIEITNLEGLRDCACECYQTVKTHYDRLLFDD
jgi:CRP-like cAMP-binding protein